MQVSNRSFAVELLAEFLNNPEKEKDGIEFK